MVHIEVAFGVTIGHLVSISDFYVSYLIKNGGGSLICFQVQQFIKMKQKAELYCHRNSEKNLVKNFM